MYICHCFLLTDYFSEPKTINFARSALNNCPEFAKKEEVAKPDFKPHHIYGVEGTVFTAEIGQAGSNQGYKALTGAKMTLKCSIK